MTPEIMTFLVFGVLIFGIAMGVPIAFVLAGVGVLFTFILWGPVGMVMITTHLYSAGLNAILIAVPLFIFMANILEKSDIADDLYKAMHLWFSRIPGGLASGTVIICAIFASMAGISGVATITMGLIAIPSMLKRDYSKNIAVGTVAAGGALGILIPPSIIAVIYGSITETSVGSLFTAGVIPGLGMALIFIVYITVKAILDPASAPAEKENFTLKEKFVSLKGVILPLILILSVLGTIYGGVATVSEAAAFGAFGALICCAIKKNLSWKIIDSCLSRTFTMTVMVIWITFGAHCFTSVYSIGGASAFVLNLVQGWDISPIIMVWLMMAIWLILGCVLDPMGMLLITIPIFAPIIKSFDFNMVWFGILFIIMCEMAYITPPFGFNLFYMRSVVPRSISMTDIYRSIFPFVLLQFICLILIIYFPQIALWLPSTMMTK